MKNLSFYLLYPVFYIVGLFPQKAHFYLADMLYIVIHKIVKYRVSVVKDNLQKSFPEKTQAELEDIEEKFYRHLADIFVETVSLSSISEKTIRKRMTFLNPHQQEMVDENKSWIAAMSHYASWEYTISYGLYSLKDEVLAVYKPLANKGMDKVFKKIRARFKTTPTPMNQIGRKLIMAQKENRTYTIALISDQNAPVYQKNDRWEEFLGRKTLFFGGMEQFALKYKIPVGFLHMDKIKRGYYISWLELIYDGKEEVAQGEITKRYVQKLDKMIRQRPELWMWSHRRWKIRYEDYN